MIKFRPISSDLKNTTLNQVWRLFAGPVILLLIPFYLSGAAQGYWFTFTNLAALSVFADLGFMNIILQFSAHEFAHLSFDEKGRFVGEKERLERISSLFIFTIKRALKLCVIVFPLILLIGFFVLGAKQQLAFESWFFPWLIYGLASMLVFLNNVVLYFIEGCNSVGNIQKIRFLIFFANSAVVILALVLKTELYALAFGLLLSSMFGTFCIAKKYRHTIAQLLKSADIGFDWGRQIYPLLKRYSISWISGYFIFSILTPIAFYFYGAVEAGKIGMSIAVWGAISSVANIWLVSIMPSINIYVSRKNYAALNPLFFKRVKLSATTFLLCSCLFFALYFLLQGASILDRISGTTSLLMLFVAYFAQIFIAAFAVYMRAHKEEPLMNASVASGILTTASTLLIVYALPTEYFFLGYLCGSLLLFLWSFKLFKEYERRKDETK